jgi:hypothetical protein
MNSKQAIKKAQQMLDETDTRSRICSFINQLESSKLIKNKTADALVDILSSDRCNGRPVLQMILRYLRKEV